MDFNFESNPFASISNIHVARLIMLVNNEGLDRIRQYVLDNLPRNSTLEMEMGKNKIRLLDLVKERKINIKTDQIQLLYPPPGEPINQDKLKFGTWYTLARNITVGCQKLKWARFEKNPPESNDVKAYHDVIRIRNLRNDLAHLIPSQLGTIVQLNPLWVEVTGALERLGTSHTTIRSYYMADVEPTRSFALYVQMKEEALEEKCIMYDKEVIKRNCLFIGFVLLFIALMGAVAALTLFITKYATTYSSCGNHIEIIPTGAVGPSGAFRFMPRSGWDALPPKKVNKSPERPANYTIISQTASIGRCDTADECCSMVRSVQKLSMQRGFDDISYNFLIGDDAVIYEGRGWDSMGAAAQGWNTISMGIAFIGNFQNQLPSNDALEAAVEFLQYMAYKNILTHDFTIYGLCQVRSNFSYAPGPALYKNIKTWNGRMFGYDWSWRPRNVSYCASDNQTALL